VINEPDVQVVNQAYVGIRSPLNNQFCNKDMLVEDQQYPREKVFDLSIGVLSNIFGIQ